MNYLINKLSVQKAVYFILFVYSFCEKLKLYWFCLIEFILNLLVDCINIKKDSFNFYRIKHEDTIIITSCKIK